MTAPPVYPEPEVIYWRIIIIPELGNCPIDVQDDQAVVLQLYP